MLENISKIRIYNFFQDFVVYFVPTFSTAMLGYILNYQSVQDTFFSVLRLGTIISIIITLIFFTSAGKVIYESVHATLNVLQILHRHVSVFLAFKFKFLRRFITSPSKSGSTEEITGKALETILSSDPGTKAWFARIQMTSQSFQTAFGSLLIAFTVFDNDRALLLTLCVIVFILSVRARSQLERTKRDIAQYAQKNK